jgi:hypothetical protein
MTFGGYRDASRLYEFGDHVRAVLPLFGSRLPFGARQSPPAAWGFGGLLATAPLTANHIRAVLNDLGRHASSVTQIRPNPIDADLWREAAPPGWAPLSRTAHILDLSGGFENVWARRFRQDTRNRVRRAQRAGLEVECDADGRLIPEFYGLLRRSFERWGHRQHEPMALARWRGSRRDPESKFYAIAKSLGSVFRLWIARLGGEPAAAILVLQDREAHYTRGAMDEKLAGPTFANYLLHSLAIEAACNAGCCNYHMGETGGSASLAQFKSRFGAAAVPYSEYRYERIPISWIESGARKLVKRVIGFRDA